MTSLHAPPSGFAPAYMRLEFTGDRTVDTIIVLYLVFGSAAALVARLEESHPFLPPRWWVIALKVTFWPAFPVIGWFTRRRW